MRALRFRCLVVGVVCYAGTALWPCLGAQMPDALALQERLVSVFQQNKDAIVRVKAAYAGPQEEGKTEVMLKVGTGFFISRDGHVLVSASRAAGADRIWIEYQGKSYMVEPVGHDRLTNISILKLVDPPAEFSIISVDTSLPRPKLGAIAVAISCPLDFEPSPALGIVSGVDKQLGNKVFPTEYIRTTISVDAGQGGCPILDINGRFIGMSVAAIPELNASYCLPADALARVRDDLLFSGHVVHGWMGFEVAERLNTDDTHAVYLSTVVEDSPAEVAGLQQGDHLISIEGRPIRDVSDVPGAIFFTRAGQFASVQVRRADQVLELSVKTQARPDGKTVIEPVEPEAASETVAVADAAPKSDD